MKRSSDYSSQGQESHKKQRYSSSQGAYGYAMSSPASSSNIGMSFSQGGPDMYGQYGSLGQFMNNQQYQQSGSQMSGMGSFQQMAANTYSGSTGQFGNNGVAAAAAQYAASAASFTGPGSVNDMSSGSRTVYLGQLPAGVSVEELCNVIRGGMLEQVKILDEKNCAFITFVDSNAANLFYNDANNRRLSINNVEVKVGWGKPTGIAPEILSALQTGASRNVFIGNIDETVTEQGLQQDLSKFGTIDQIKILPDKRIAFVHMASISASVKAVQQLPQDPKWANRRINYGRDRCANQGYNMQGYALAGYDAFGGTANRTVYIGNLHPETTMKDLCDVIRGGILEKIKIAPEKKYAFATFVDPNAALALFNRGNSEGVVVKGKRVRVNWGKPSALPGNVQAAVQAGASRNVYIGNIDETITEDKLRKDFGPYGEIELVNIIPDKNIGFVNFTDIQSAMKAVESMKLSPDYAAYKINFGKDRCGNPPRPREVRSQSVLGTHMPGFGMAGAPGTSADGSGVHTLAGGPTGNGVAGAPGTVNSAAGVVMGMDGAGYGLAVNGTNGYM